MEDQFCEVLIKRGIVNPKLHLENIVNYAISEKWLGEQSEMIKDLMVICLDIIKMGQLNSNLTTLGKKDQIFMAKFLIFKLVEFKLILDDLGHKMDTLTQFAMEKSITSYIIVVKTLRQLSKMNYDQFLNPSSNFDHSLIDLLTERYTRNFTRMEE